MPDDTAPRPARELTRDEAQQLFDARARERLGMTGDEFLAAWDADELDRDNNDVIAVWMLSPFGRATPSD